MDQDLESETVRGFLKNVAKVSGRLVGIVAAGIISVPAGLLDYIDDVYVTNSPNRVARPFRGFGSPESFRLNPFVHRPSLVGCVRTYYGRLRDGFYAQKDKELMGR